MDADLDETDPMEGTSGLRQPEIVPFRDIEGPSHPTEPTYLPDQAREIVSSPAIKLTWKPKPASVAQIPRPPTIIDQTDRVVEYIRGDSIPQQKRLMKNMNPVTRRRIIEDNEKVRIKWLDAANANPTKIFLIKPGPNLQLGIPYNGHILPPQSDPWWNKVLRQDPEPEPIYFDENPPQTTEKAVKRRLGDKAEPISKLWKAGDDL